MDLIILTLAYHSGMLLAASIVCFLLCLVGMERAVHKHSIKGVNYFSILSFFFVFLIVCFTMIYTKQKRDNDRYIEMQAAYELHRQGKIRIFDENGKTYPISIKDFDTLEDFIEEGCKVGRIESDKWCQR